MADFRHSPQWNPAQRVSARTVSAAAHLKAQCPGQRPAALKEGSPFLLTGRHQPVRRQVYLVSALH
jgi:hypothetical protein